MGFEDKDLLVRYLLGDLSEPDRKHLERTILASDQAREALTAVENDLIDSYVRGELSPKQRQQFEDKFLDSATKHEQLAVAKMLMDPAVRENIATLAVPSRKTSTPWREVIASLLRSRTLAVRFALVLAGMALLVTAFLSVQNWRLHTELTNLRSSETELQRQLNDLRQKTTVSGAPEKNAGDNSTAETARLQLPQILLTPGVMRKAGTGQPGGQLAIPPDAPAVLLMLDLNRDRYSSYEVVLETVEGAQLQRMEGLASVPQKGGKVIELRLPSQLLRKGDYIITLSGRGADGRLHAVDSYDLSVVR